MGSWEFVQPNRPPLKEGLHLYGYINWVLKHSPGFFSVFFSRVDFHKANSREAAVQTLYLLIHLQNKVTPGQVGIFGFVPCGLYSSL